MENNLNFTQVEFKDIDNIIEDIFTKNGNVYPEIPETVQEMFQEFYNSLSHLEKLVNVCETTLTTSWYDFVKSCDKMERYSKNYYWRIKPVVTKEKYYVSYTADVMSPYERSLHLEKDIVEFLKEKGQKMCELSSEYFSKTLNIGERKLKIQKNPHLVFSCEIPGDKILQNPEKEQVTLEKLRTLSQKLTKHFITLRTRDRELKVEIFKYLYQTTKDFKNPMVYKNFVNEMIQMEPKLEIGRRNVCDGENSNELEINVLMTRDDEDIYDDCVECEYGCECDYESRKVSDWYQEVLKNHLELAKRINLKFNDYFPYDMVETCIKDDYGRYLSIKITKNALKL